MKASIIGWACWSGMMLAQPAVAAQAQNYSGVYQCSGEDAKEGHYTGTVTLLRKPAHSHGAYASYDFKLEVPGYGTYLGHAAGNGPHLAMHFGLKNSNDYGTGVAEFKRNVQGQLSFHKFYYEPEFKGGNTGIEDCVKQG